MQDFSIPGTKNTSKWQTRASWEHNFAEKIEEFKSLVTDQGFPITIHPGRKVC